MFAPAGPARCLSVAFAVILAAATPAFGQTRLVSQYSISIAGITIGQGELTADVDVDGYVAQGSGRASGFLRILVSGQAQVSARGRLIEGRPAPTAFSARLDDENEHSAVAMTFDHGSVKALEAETSLPASDRVPVTAEYRRDVSDPVSALLVPAADGLAPAACQRTLHIFDGQRRYDLMLSYKRVDTAKAAGHTGSVVVCAVALKPIAGHKPGSALVKYLTGGRELELWLAPIAGTRLLGPYRLSVANLIGDLVIAATSYETISSSAPLPLRPSIAPDTSAK
jgi:hypothetical protein